MPRYFFHLRSEDNLVWDDEGVDLPDPLTAQGAADKTDGELGVDCSIRCGMTPVRQSLSLMRAARSSTP